MRCVYVCVCVKSCLSCSCALVKSTDGPLHTVQRSGFYSTSGSALWTKTAFFFNFLSLALRVSHTPTHRHAHTHSLRALIHSCTLHSAVVGAVVVVGVCWGEWVCLLPLECKWNWENFILSIFLCSSKCPNISTAEQTRSPSCEMYSADSLSLSLSPPRT